MGLRDFNPNNLGVRLWRKILPLRSWNNNWSSGSTSSKGRIVAVVVAGVGVVGVVGVVAVAAEVVAVVVGIGAGAGISMIY